MLLHNLQQSAPLSFGGNTYWSWLMVAVVSGTHLLHRESEGTCCLYEQYIHFLLVRVVGLSGIFKQLFLSTTYKQDFGRLFVHESIGSQSERKLFFSLRHNLGLAKK